MTAAWGAGLATVTAAGTVLDTWFPHVGLGELPDRPWQDLLPSVDADLDVRGYRRERVLMTIETDDAPTSTSDAYLRLHLLSNRLVLPRSINLDGIFAALPNNAWTDLGPVQPDQVDELRLVWSEPDISVPAAYHILGRKADGLGETLLAVVDPSVQEFVVDSVADGEKVFRVVAVDDAGVALAVSAEAQMSAQALNALYLPLAQK